MSEDFSNYFTNLIKSIWNDAGAWPAYAETMRLALSSFGGEKSVQTPGSSRWARLPGRCCQAAGGEYNWAGELTSAWILFYLAAHIMDAVQDGDPPADWWREAGPGVAINTASGLYFTASQVLQSLHNHQQTQAAAHDISRLFYDTGLVMCSGQHMDLTEPFIRLDDYWSMAAGKSGVFFALACRAGARLATDNLEKLEKFADFGRNLGILIQILDDLDEFRSSRDSEIPGIGRNLFKSLPAIYSLEVLEGHDKEILLSLLRAAPEDPDAHIQAVEIIDRCGAALFVKLQLEAYRNRALTALNLVAANGAAKADLEMMISGF